MQHCKLIRRRLYHLVHCVIASGATGIGPLYLLDQHRHMSRHSAGSTCHGDAQPIADLLADRGTASEADLKVAINSRAGHENSSGLTAVRTDKARLKLRTVSRKARSTEVGPVLPRTAAIDDMNDKPAALLQGDRRFGFDGRGKSGKYEQGGCDKGGNRGS